MGSIISDISPVKAMAIADQMVTELQEENALNIYMALRLVHMALVKRAGLEVSNQKRMDRWLWRRAGWDVPEAAREGRAWRTFGESMVPPGRHRSASSEACRRLQKDHEID